MTTGADCRPTSWVRPSSRSNPGGAENDVGVVLQGVAEVDDLRAGIAHDGPDFRDIGLVGGEEGEIDALQMLGQNPLNERRLVIDLIELAERVSPHPEA